MYCPKCGKENPDNAQLCCSCSWVLTSIITIGPAPDARTSKLAVTSLVLAILSFFTLFITALPALIFGIISIFKIEKSGGQLKGKGLAIAGIAVPATLAPFALMLGILMPALARVRMTAQKTVCGSNLRTLSAAMIMYADDNDGMYPTTSKWCDLLIEYIDEEYFKCSRTSEGRCNYAMNKTIEKLGTDSSPDMVLLFETWPGWNQAGGPEILTTNNHNGEGCNVVFIDLHAQFVRTEDINDLRWTPEQ
jgi:hypothetical protein